MKKTKYLLLALLLILALTITACTKEQTNDQNANDNDTEEPILGGDTDEYGCIPSAGYTWCPSLNECVRVWETQCPEYEEYYREPGICTKEYMPVTGELTIPTQEGEITIIQTFGNRCEAETKGATNIQPLNQEKQVTNFQECKEAGNPIMESFPRGCIHQGEYFTEELNYEELNLPENKYEACAQIGGTPLPEFNECEYIPEDACTYIEGKFYECESACRNDPEAEFCTLQCVQVCKFN
ncbi:hypothetical protein KO361_01945 [Candidatus Woesearchaeota archaeon]|nr:hypothetical protein [Candidatus Woesearchaeota archaeon]